MYFLALEGSILRHSRRIFTRRRSNRFTNFSRIFAGKWEGWLKLLNDIYTAKRTNTDELEPRDGCMCVCVCSRRIVIISQRMQ